MIKQLSTCKQIAFNNLFWRKTTTKDELTQTITKSIGELGFARIAKPAILDVFSSGEPASFDIHDKLKEFADNQGLNYQDDADEDFYVFRSSNTEQ